MKRTLLFLGFILLWLSAAVARHPVKILAIGNSFSEDAIENNLHELAADAGITTVLGNMYIPGCPLELHAKNAAANARTYRYRKIGTDGRMSQTDSMQLSRALADEDWDYVSLQQASHFSGCYDTYQPYLHRLVEYIRARVPGKTKIIFHQTWAYAQNSTRAGYEFYGKDQKKMFRAIVSATRQAVRDEGISIVVPCGTAIQNARTSSYGDTMNRDGFHLNLLYGRYTAACTWFAKLFRRKVSGNGYVPKGMTPQQVKVSQAAADAAVKHPWIITKINF